MQGLEQVYNCDVLGICGLPGSGKDTFYDTFHDHVNDKYGVELRKRGVGNHFRDQYKAERAEADDPESFPDFFTWWNRLPLPEQRSINAELLDEVEAGEWDVIDSRYLNVFTEAGIDMRTVFFYAPANIRAKRADYAEYEDKLPAELQGLPPEKQAEHRDAIVNGIMDAMFERVAMEERIGRILWEPDWIAAHGERYDYKDRNHYDLMVNTAEWTPQEEARIVDAALTV